jgi:hypothetical protein
MTIQKNKQFIDIRSVFFLNLLFTLEQKEKINKEMNLRKRGNCESNDLQAIESDDNRVATVLISHWRKESQKKIQDTMDI